MKTKLFLIGLISIVLCLCLTGCGAQEKTTQNDIENQINSLIDDIFSETDATNSSTSATTDKARDVSDLYKDNTLVFEDDDDTYMVFTYSGEKITGYSVYIVYESEEIAKLALNEYNLDPDEDVKRAYVDGNRVVIEYDESVYDDLTTTAVKFLYTIEEKDLPN